MPNFSSPDLTQYPPRSPRVRLGGYVHLARLLDKARAHSAGKIGEYHYNCSLDQRFFAFTGIDQEAILAEAKKGGSDSAMLAWVQERAKKDPSQIAVWSAWMEQFGPGGHEGHVWMGGVIEKSGPERSDIRSFFDLLDLDDYVTFGGKG